MNDPAEIPPPVSPVESEYRRVLPLMREVLSEEEYRSWEGYFRDFGAGPGRSSEMALEYLKASAVLAERWPYQYLGSWASMGRDLGQGAPDAAAAYFRSSPAVLAYLRAGEVVTWGSICGRLLEGGWQSGALAAQLLEVSPELLRFLDLSELGMLTDLLQLVVQGWYPAARQCLALAAEVLPGLPSSERQRVLVIASTLAARNAAEAGEWLLKAGSLLSGLDSTARVPLLALAGGVAREGGDVAAVTAFLHAAAGHLAAVPAADQAQFLSHAARIGSLSAGAADDFLRSSATLVTRMPGERLEAWVREGMMALREAPESGRAYFRLESSRSVSQLRELSPAVDLASVAELLRLYCTALTGERVQVQPTSHLVERGIGWTAEQRPTTEGNAIFLPELVQAHQTQRENFERLKVYALHQAGHLEFGSFRFRFEGEGAVLPPVRWQLEASRAEGPAPAGGGDDEPLTDLERFFRLFHQRRMAQDVFTLVEDARIDARIQAEYAGVRAALRRAQQAEGEERPAVRTLPPRTALLEALLQGSLMSQGSFPAGARRGEAGNLPAPAIDVPGPLRPHYEAAWSFVAPLLRPEATVEDAAESTLRVYLLAANLPLAEGEGADAFGFGMPVEDLLEELMGLRSSTGHAMDDLMRDLDSTEEEDYEPVAPVDYRGDFKPQLVQALMKLKETGKPSSKAAPSPVSMDALQRLLEGMQEIEVSELSETSDGETSGLFVTNLMRETGHATEAEPPPGSAFRARPAQVDGPLVSRAPNEHLYDEWDFRAGAYRPAWCLVRERVLDPAAAEYYDVVLARHSRLARVVQRQFEALRPELFKKIKNLNDGEEYDLDAVVAAAVDRRAHQSPSEKIYWRRNKIERNVAVALLLDVSASTDEDAKKEQRPQEDWPDWDQDSDRFLLVLRERLRQQEVARRSRRRIIDVERESAVLLVQALEALGDAYGVYGFSGYGRDGVEVYVVKGLEEAFGEVTKARVGNLEPVRGTRMGAAIRHVTTKLDAWDARTKLLLLVSDGRPQDHDYGRDRTERDYALHDTRKALLEAKQKRIVPFALTVDREGHDYLKTICAGIGYEVVDDIEALPTRLPAIYRELAF